MIDEREWTLTLDFEHPHFSVADGPSLRADQSVVVVPKASREAVEAKLVEVEGWASVGRSGSCVHSTTWEGCVGCEIRNLRAKLVEAERKLAAPKATPRSILRAQAHTRGVCPICSQAMDIDPKLSKAVEALRVIRRISSNGEVDPPIYTATHAHDVIIETVDRVLSELEAKND